MTDDFARSHGYDRRGPHADGSRPGSGFSCKCAWSSQLHGDHCPEHGYAGRKILTTAEQLVADLTAEVDRLSKRVELAEATIAEMNRLDVLAAETQEVIDRAHEAECDRLQEQRDDLANIVARLTIDPETIRRSEEDFKAGRYRNLIDIITERAAGLDAKENPDA